MTTRPWTAKMDQARKKIIVEMLQKHSGNKTRAAAEMGIDRQHLYRLVKKYGLGAR